MLCSRKTELSLLTVQQNCKLLQPYWKITQRIRKLLQQYRKITSAKLKNNSTNQKITLAKQKNNPTNQNSTNQKITLAKLKNYFSKTEKWNWRWYPGQITPLFVKCVWGITEQIFTLNFTVFCFVLLIIGTSSQLLYTQRWWRRSITNCKHMYEPAKASQV